MAFIPCRCNKYIIFKIESVLFYYTGSNYIGITMSVCLSACPSICRRRLLSFSSVCLISVHPYAILKKKFNFVFEISMLSFDTALATNLNYYLSLYLIISNYTDYLTDLYTNTGKPWAFAAPEKKMYKIVKDEGK